MQETSPNILCLFAKEEQRYSKHLNDATRNSGGNPIFLDYYHGPINLRKIDRKSLTEMLSVDPNAVQTVYQLIHDEVFRQNYIKILRAKSDVILQKEITKWMEENNISGIMLPGDNFNFDCPPYHEEPKIRPRFSQALLNIAKEKEMPLAGFCGGLQAIMAAEGIKVKRVSEILETIGKNPTYAASAASLHVISEEGKDIDPNFLARNAREQILTPGTRIQKIINNGSVLIPEAHGGALDHTDPENIIKLYQLGYQIAARSPDSIIQIVEHTKHPISLFQGHPEALAAVKDPTATKVLQSVLIEPARQYEKTQQYKGIRQAANTHVACANVCSGQVQPSPQTIMVS